MNVSAELWKKIKLKYTSLFRGIARNTQASSFACFWAMLMLGLCKSKLGTCFLKRENGSLFESFQSLHKQAHTPLACDDCTSFHYLEWNVKKNVNMYILQ